MGRCHVALLLMMTPFTHTPYLLLISNQHVCIVYHFPRIRKDVCYTLPSIPAFLTPPIVAPALQMQIPSPVIAVAATWALTCIAATLACARSLSARIRDTPRSPYTAVMSWALALRCVGCLFAAVPTILLIVGVRVDIALSCYEIGARPSECVSDGRVIMLAAGLAFALGAEVAVFEMVKRGSGGIASCVMYVAAVVWLLIVNYMAGNGFLVFWVLAALLCGVGDGLRGSLVWFDAAEERQAPAKEPLKMEQQSARV